MSNWIRALAVLGPLTLASPGFGATLHGHWSFTAPKNATDLHFDFNTPDDLTVGGESDQFDFHVFLPTDSDGNTINEMMFARSTGSFSGGETIVVTLRATANDIFNPAIVDAWWTFGFKQPDTGEDPKPGKRMKSPTIDVRDLGLFLTRPTDPIVVANHAVVPLPGAGGALAAGLALLGLVARRRNA
ncbi:hypothetical protein SAMN05421688_0267 [Poseidonocella pacifica]|uniref:VPLPA-CTERM protein sorting domain-containing protein n=1 Tax=Poseidonocella pacifica TaxID=871651 RepID=A0A1I0V4H3_9RHOB|nr:hypothetical protein [Poseidonocella pacifica]SFA70957.1 hypothetical protein SAMN05421688_0267 [Poseidonocella pacifica]